MSRQGGSRNDEPEKKKKESILELSKFMDRQLRIKFQGGREVTGTLKGYDMLLNVVLDETIEYIKDLEDEGNPQSSQTRKLGLSVCRGNTIISICPVDGFGEIENPFLQAE